MGNGKTQTGYPQTKNNIQTHKSKSVTSSAVLAQSQKQYYKAICIDTYKPVQVITSLSHMAIRKATKQTTIIGMVNH